MLNIENDSYKRRKQFWLYQNDREMKLKIENILKK